MPDYRAGARLRRPLRHGRSASGRIDTRPPGKPLTAAEPRKQQHASHLTRRRREAHPVTCLVLMFPLIMELLDLTIVIEEPHCRQLAQVIQYSTCAFVLQHIGDSAHRPPTVVDPQ
jgi:hypothetical protein